MEVYLIPGVVDFLGWQYDSFIGLNLIQIRLNLVLVEIHEHQFKLQRVLHRFRLIFVLNGLYRKKQTKFFHVRA